MENIYDVDAMSEEEAENKAHALGWRPKDEFSGDPDKFTDAKTFLQKANENIPMLRENYRKIDAQNQKFSEQIEQLTKQIAGVNQRLIDAEKRGYEKAVADIEAAQRAAALDGDMEKYDALQKRKDDLSLKSSTAPQAPQNVPQGEPLPIEDRIALEIFQSQNPWFKQDAELNEDMCAYVMGIKSRNPNISMSDVLQKAKEKVVKANPLKFANQKSVNDVLTSTTSTPNRSTYGDLKEKAIYDSEWAYMEREMRIKGKSDAEIEKFKKIYQTNCLNNK